MKPSAGRRSQEGIVLLISLIMLVLVTLLVVGAFNLGKSNLQSVANMQNHEEAVATAQAAIEEVVSTTNFSESPATAFGTGNVKSYTINGRTDAYEVALSPQPCIRSYKNLTADPSDATAQGCIAGQQQNFGVAGTITSGSNCADAIWEITAVATDTLTNATTTVTQGMQIRQDAASAASTANFCS